MRGRRPLYEMFHFSPELGTSYKNGNFLEIQLRVFIVTSVIKETIFEERL